MSSPEDSNGLVLMDNELVISDKTDVCLGLHRNVHGHWPPVGPDIFRVHKVLKVFEDRGSGARMAASKVAGARLHGFW